MSWRVPGIPRKYFDEELPALFERTLELDDFKGDASKLEWIFTGPLGGFTVEAGAGRLRVYQRHYDSFGLKKAPAAQAEARAERCRRRPQGKWRYGSKEG